MTSFDLVIRNGLIVNADGRMNADVGIRDGKIVAIADRLEGGTREIDASGKLVLPGGVDSHTHIEQSGSGGGQNGDTFLTGSISAACGGTTSVICFVPQKRGGSLAEATAAYHETAKKAAIDYSFHLIINDPSDQVIDEELPKLIDDGHRSIKLFMTYDGNFVNDAQILRIFTGARRNGAFVCVHAENHEAIKWQTAALEAAGLVAPKYHAWSKPPVVEREATHRVIALAEMVDQPIQVFHVTCDESAAEIDHAQQRGLKVWGETCIQYLVLTADDMDRPGTEGAKFICSPSPRTVEDQQALWGYLKRGVLDVVTSDHAPYNYNGDEGKWSRGRDVSFAKIANGVPGLETRLPLLFTEGVKKGRIDLETFVALGSTNAARLFGLYPQKGTIVVGADADIAIWDPERKVTIRQDDLHHAVDYTPYEGREVTGWPVITISRGEVLWNDGEVTAERGRGRFLPREAYDYIKPRGIFPTGLNPITGEVAE